MITQPYNCNGKVRWLSGEALREIAFPLGRIGTDTVSLGGHPGPVKLPVFHPGRHHKRAPLVSPDDKRRDRVGEVL